LGVARGRVSALENRSVEDVYDEVLEIGFGTGLNLSHYPNRISHLSIVEPADILPKKVGTRIAAVSFPFHTHHGHAETLPFSERQFDAVVST